MSACETLSVSQVTAYIKSLFAMDSLLADVWVSGEVSNFKQATSGHCYFTLKDGDACLKSVIWRTAARGLSLPRDGDAVLAHGYISVYESQGAYQFYVDRLQAAGAGQLWQEFERLRARLTEEGLFDETRKRGYPGSRSASASPPLPAQRPCATSCAPCPPATHWPTSCWRLARSRARTPRQQSARRSSCSIAGRPSGTGWT